MCSRQEDERPATRQGIPDARETTGAVPGASVTRLALNTEIPDLDHGEVVEIDLRAAGSVYESMRLCPTGGDRLRLIIVADLLERRLHELEDIGKTRELSSWMPFLLRLQAVAELLDENRLQETRPIRVLVRVALEELLNALRWEKGWESVTSILKAASTGCADLARKAEQAIMEHYERECPLRFQQLHQGVLCNNPEAICQGLVFAARLGLDLNQLEIGSSGEGVVAEVLRGRKL